MKLVQGWPGESDDVFLQSVTEQVFDAFGRDRIRAFWLAGHSRGGITPRRIVCSDYFKTRVDGWLSLSGGRLGATRTTFGRAPAAELPSCDISFIYTAGQLEIESLPATSPWAEKYGCGARERRADIVDSREAM